MASPADVLRFAQEMQVIVTEEAVEKLKDLDFRGIIESLAKQGHFIITGDLIRLPENTVVVQRRKKEIPAREVDYRPRIFDEYDVTGKTGIKGEAEEFRDYFLDRFRRLKEIFLKRGMHVRDLSKWNKVSRGNEFFFVGMVYDKRMSKKGHVILEIEDEYGKIVVLVTKEEPETFEKAMLVLPDDVIAVRGRKLNEELLLASEIFFPEVPKKTPNYAPDRIYAAITSDWHVGSKLFLKDAMEKFIQFLKGEYGNGQTKEIQGRIKYLIIAGDLVDGIGIYPDQKEELEYPDIYKQYEEFQRLILEVPDYIHVIITPGNHDAVRREEPQPAIPWEYFPDLKGLDNIHPVGSPSYVSLAGVEFLLYHGTSLDDLIAALPHVDYEHPEEAMAEYLRRRHLSPTYGWKNPIVPEKKDYMIIERVPDVFVCGHVHKNGYKNYRGVSVVNPGTFQDQTKYQVENGHVPTPGRVPVMDLSNHAIKEVIFWRSP